MGIILLIISSILKWILTPVMYIYGCIIAIKKGEFEQYNLDLAISKDIYGNVLGKNQRDNTLTGLGNEIAGILNELQPNHCLNSIDNTV